MSERSEVELETVAARYFDARRDRRLWSCEPEACLDAELWDALSANGFTAVGIDEHLGGSGGTAADAATLLSLSGRTAAAIPLMEHMWLAGWLLTQAGIPLAKGPSTACAGDLTFERTSHGLQVSGVLERVPWARSCREIVVLCPDGTVAMVPASVCSIVHGANPIGEPRDRVEVSKALLGADGIGRTTLGQDELLARGALGRLIQIEGAARAALERSVRYVGQREQFGRPLARFQAVQQRLAVVARECALLHVGVRLCMPGPGGSDRRLDIAAAKHNASLSVPTIVSNVHQVHGAIGITSEYGLGELTLRMSAWVAEFGSDAYWSAILADACGQDDIWDIVTGAVR